MVQLGNSHVKRCSSYFLGIKNVVLEPRPKWELIASFRVLSRQKIDDRR